MGNENETAIDEMITGEGTAASFMNKWKAPSKSIKNMFPSNMNVGLIYSPEHGGENYAISEKGGKYFLHAFIRAAEPGEGKEFNDLESAKGAIPVNTQSAPTNSIGSIKNPLGSHQRDRIYGMLGMGGNNMNESDRYWHVVDS